jgi:ubiquinone/menaquinone biosynthesis C-methylase UbiE
LKVAARVDTRDILQLGCGHNYLADAVNVDLRSDLGADVVCDLNQRPWPFPDNRFRMVLAVHVLEHLHDTVAAIEEIHRVSRPGAIVKITTPHFSSPNAFTDPTHCHFFGYFSFTYFTGENIHAFRDAPMFRRLATRISFAPTRLSIINRLLDGFANQNPHRYERRLMGLLPADQLYNELEVLKNT